MKSGDRALCPDGWVGTVTAVNGTYVDVRIDTPDGEPSWLTSCYRHDTLVSPIPANVSPRPASREWRRKSAEFCAALERLCWQHFR